MATIRKHRDKWQAQIRLKGIKPIAKSFGKRSEAVAWARVVESRVTEGKYIDPRSAERVTLAEVIDRYLAHKKSQGRESRPEQSRLERLRAHLGAFSLINMGKQRVSEYRDRQLLVKNPATVVHELSLLLRVLKYAREDLGIPLPQGLPRVRLPKMPYGRVRRLAADEELKLLAILSDDPEMKSFVLLALETAMRRSEIVNMKWQDIDWKSSTLTIPMTKNGMPRTIPLSNAARTVLTSLQRSGEQVFSFSASVASQRFMRACERAGITGLRLHDLRHEAISRLFELGLNQMEVAAISGHRTVAMLSRYTHIGVEHLTRRIGEVNGLRRSFPQPAS